MIDAQELVVHSIVEEK